MWKKQKRSDVKKEGEKTQALGVGEGQCTTRDIGAKMRRKGLQRREMKGVKTVKVIVTSAHTNPLETREMAKEGR